MITHEKNKVRGSNAKSSQRHVLSHNNTDNDLDIKRDQQDESVDTALRKKCDGLCQTFISGSVSPMQRCITKNSSKSKH